jgi:K+-transporting ATPase KdpF subunit
MSFTSPSLPDRWWRAGGSSRRAIACEGQMDYVIAGAASALLFVYLIYALLRPERF